MMGNCPLPVSSLDRITLGHGGGGLLSSQLVDRLFLAGYGNNILAALEDQAIVSLPGAPGAPASHIAITTDSFVVRPLFFPGGDIGKLAIHGTVNDLAVGGATPLYLTAAFILEEGLAIADPRAHRRLDAARVRGGSGSCAGRRRHKGGRSR